MNLIETLVSKAAEEACELGKAWSKLNTAGIKSVDAESGQPRVLEVIKQFNDSLAVVELLRDRGIALAGIGDPVAIGEAKNAIVQDMEEAMKAGVLVLSEDDQNPRPEGVNESGTGLPGEGDGNGDGEGDGDEGMGDAGTGASDADGTAGDGIGGADDNDGSGGDDNSSDDLGDGSDEGEGDNDSSDDDSSGDNDGDDSDEEEEEEESGSNDV